MNNNTINVHFRKDLELEVCWKDKNGALKANLDTVARCKDKDLASKIILTTLNLIIDINGCDELHNRYDMGDFYETTLFLTGNERTSFLFSRNITRGAMIQLYAASIKYAVLHNNNETRKTFQIELPSESSSSREKLKFIKDVFEKCGFPDKSDILPSSTSYLDYCDINADDGTVTIRKNNGYNYEKKSTFKLESDDDNSTNRSKEASNFSTTQNNSTNTTPSKPQHKKSHTFGYQGEFNSYEQAVVFNIWDDEDIIGTAKYEDCIKDGVYGKVSVTILSDNSNSVYFGRIKIGEDGMPIFDGLVAELSHIGDDECFVMRRYNNPNNQTYYSHNYEQVISFTTKDPGVFFISNYSKNDGKCVHVQYHFQLGGILEVYSDINNEYEIVAEEFRDQICTLFTETIREFNSYGTACQISPARRYLSHEILVAIYCPPT